MKLQFDVPMVKIELDEPMRALDGETMSGTRMDFLMIEGQKTTQEVWERQSDARAVLAVIREICDKREYAILRDYFIEGKVMEDIGKTYGIGRERVRQLIRRVRQELVKRKMMKQMPEGNKGLRGIAG